MAINEDELGTEVRKNCVFPFVAGMKLHNKCTDYQRGRKNRYWCATEVDEFKNVLSWGYCPDECSPQGK